MEAQINSNIHYPFKYSSMGGGLYRKCIKRLLDVILSLFALIVLSPVLLLVAALVRIKLGSPVIFKQKRPGLNERIFTLYKFRTMTDERDGNGNLLPDNIRLTKFGSFLRSTSIDELPELVNIIKGDMSIIGPRPLLIKDLVFMTQEQRLRQTVMPGLSGWAQVNGRNGISWEKKLDLDLEYIKNISFLKDFRIVFMTIAKVFKREGINAAGLNTAEDLGDYLLNSGKIDDSFYADCQEKSNQLLMM